MRLAGPVCATLMLVALGGCGEGSGGGGQSQGDVRLRVRMATSDPHLLGVAGVDLDLNRDNVVVRDRVSAPAGAMLSFPLEAIVRVPIGPGPLHIEATARMADGTALGGGAGDGTVAAGDIVTITVEMYSNRGRPSRSRPDAGISDPVDSGAGVDAAAPPVDTAGAPEAAADASQAQPEAGPLDMGPPPCQARTHQLIAQEVVSVDNGPPPKEPTDTRVLVSSGFAHNHVHDYVGWMRFDLSQIPERATVTSMKVSLELEQVPSSSPPLAILYSSNDGWNAQTLTSETAERVPRTARVSGDLGMPGARRQSYAVDVALYRSYWAGDLADNALTLGMISTTAPDAPETWANFYGLDSAAVSPALELVTCE
jgi:hypothetical protein